jgi:hypothetical protein
VVVILRLAAAASAMGKPGALPGPWRGAWTRVTASTLRVVEAVAVAGLDQFGRVEGLDFDRVD